VNSPGGAVDSLKRRRPEWSPWLAVVEQIHRESTASRWDAAVPEEHGTGEHSTPMLAGASIVVDGRDVRRLFERLVDLAVRGGTPKMATLQTALRGEVDPGLLFGASITQNTAQVAGIAASTGADPEALQAIVAMVSVPFLQACNRQWSSSIPGNWTEGYCPVCASWPAFAEVRGIDRSRYLRCGRCGSEWQAHILHCAFCGNRNHEDLASLVPDKAGSAGVVDACRRCHGSLKAFTRLQGCPAASVMLEDLASVDLDVAALEQGYTRPGGAGAALEVTVEATSASRRFFAWNG
jgi:FdhE protein